MSTKYLKKSFMESVVMLNFALGASEVNTSTKTTMNVRLTSVYREYIMISQIWRANREINEVKSIAGSEIHKGIDGERKVDRCFDARKQLYRVNREVSSIEKTSMNVSNLQLSRHCGKKSVVCRENEGKLPDYCLLMLVHVNFCMFVNFQNIQFYGRSCNGPSLSHTKFVAQSFQIPFLHCLLIGKHFNRSGCSKHYTNFIGVDKSINSSGIEWIFGAS